MMNKNLTALIFCLLGIPSSSNAQSMMGSADSGAGANNSASSTANQIGSSLLSQGAAQMPGCAAQMCGCCPDALMKIMMGLMGLMQGGANKDTADQHTGIGEIVSATGAGGDTSSTYDTAGSLDKVTSFGQGKSAIDNLKKYGVTYANGKFTLPNGTTMAIGDVGNAAAMSNAGVSGPDFAKNMAKAAELDKKFSADTPKISASSSGYSDSGGSHSSSSSSDSGSESVHSTPKTRDPAANVAGMSKSYNGDMIGVSGDGLFIMMNRRYQQKVRDEGFLAPEAMPR